HAVQDAGPVEPGRDGEPPGHGGGLEPADLLHPPDVQLQVRPPRGQRVQAALGAPGQIAGYDGYSRWHLGIDTEASEQTRTATAFLMGTSRRSTGPPSSTPDRVHRRTTTRRSRRWPATCSTGWTSGRTDPLPRAALPPA